MFRAMDHPKDQHPTPLHLGKWRAGLIAGILAINAMLVALACVPTARSVTTTVTVTIGETLEPSSITVAPSTVVAFRNADDERHRMQSHRGPVPFDSGERIGHGQQGRPSKRRGRREW